jgi:hypothetical protein
MICSCRPFVTGGIIGAAAATLLPPAALPPAAAPPCVLEPRAGEAISRARSRASRARARSASVPVQSACASPADAMQARSSAALIRPIASSASRAAVPWSIRAASARVLCQRRRRTRDTGPGSAAQPEVHVVAYLLGSARLVS